MGVDALLWQYVEDSTNTNCLMGYFWCGSTLIAHDKGQEGSKGGNGICHVRWVLPGVGSKAILNHTRLRWVQARGEGGQAH
jgi:hypothetical protein